MAKQNEYAGYNQHTSWGRTRRPKSITGADREAVVTVASLNAAAVITDAITGDHKNSAGNGIYQTENQRYLHLICGDSSTISNVWVYHYASGVWSELVSSGNASVAVGADDTKIIEIAGVDLVAFVVTGSEVFAACSTF